MVNLRAAGFSLVALLLLGFLPLLARDEPEPPTPAERIAGMKAECAKERAKLGTWASDKKLGIAAKAQFVLAVRLDPDSNRARQRLGHRKNSEGGWDTSREKEWEYGRGAVEKYGEELRRRELDLLNEELAAFERLALEIRTEAPDLARPLLLRVHLLAPARVAAAEALGLTPLPAGTSGNVGFATESVSGAIRNTPPPEDAGMTGMYASTIGARTITRRCLSVVAETAGDRAAADRLAVAAHRAADLTCRRLGFAPRGIGWLDIFTADTQAGFERFIDSLYGPGDQWGAVSKQVGSVRGFQPRHFAGCLSPTDPGLSAPMFCHVAAEHVLLIELGEECPAWLHESVGIDACLDLLGVPGTPCVTLEESAGLSLKDDFEKPEVWGSLLLRRAATGDMPHLSGFLRAQLTALGASDLLAGHAYYKYLLRAHGDALRAFLVRLKEGAQPEQAFSDGFGTSPEAVEEEFLSLMMGG